MTNTRMEEITANADAAALRFRAGYGAKPCPQSYTQEEAKLWQERFERAKRGIHE